MRFFSCLVSQNVFHVVSSLQSIVCLYIFNIGEVRNPARCHGNKTVQLPLWGISFFIIFIIFIKFGGVDCVITSLICTSKKFEYPWNENRYSGTPPYDHPVNTTTSLLRPLYSGPEKAQSVIFLFKEPLQYDHPVNTTRFPWPEGGRINEVPLYLKIVNGIFLVTQSTCFRFKMD